MKVDQPRRQELLSFGSLPPHSPHCPCVVCVRQQPFKLPSDLVDRFLDGKVVLIAGAGISTEAHGVTRNTFYEEIDDALKDENKPNRSFPDLMEAFCQSPAGRSGLIAKIKNRFDYVFSHREIFDDATRFHSELATFYPIDTIVTTNWDTYFEDQCGATAFVEEKDVALWEVADRRVLKLHGTIANFGSIVATSSDYKKCAKRLNRGIVGAVLKSLLATRATVFVGYSLRDDDFLQVYRAVRRHLADFHHQAYFIAPRISDEDKLRLTKLNLRLIEADGQYFLSEIKRYAHKKRILCHDEMYEAAADLLAMVRQSHEWLHEKYDAAKCPQILFTSWYQDGMQHALERIVRLRGGGSLSDPSRLKRTANIYGHCGIRFRRDKKFDDSAYCYGYANGYRFVSQFANRESDIELPPLFYTHEQWHVRKSTYHREIGRFARQHPTAFKFAARVMAEHAGNPGLVPHHIPQLSLGQYLDELEDS